MDSYWNHALVLLVQATMYDGPRKRKRIRGSIGPSCVECGPGQEGRTDRYKAQNATSFARTTQQYGWWRQNEPKVDSGDEVNRAQEELKTLRNQLNRFRERYGEAEWEWPQVAGPSSEDELSRIRVANWTLCSAMHVHESATYPEGYAATAESKPATYRYDEPQAMAHPGTLQCPLCSKVVAQASGMPPYLQTHVGLRRASTGTSIILRMPVSLK